MKNIGLILTLARLYLSVTAFLVPRKLIINSLVIRQSNGNTTLPQCESPCSPIVPFVGPNPQDQCTPQVCCTAAFEEDYLNCFKCIGKAENITNYSQYQTSLDELTSACLADGITVPKLTFPGQNPNRTLTSFTPSSTLTSTAGAPGIGTGTAVTTVTTAGTTVIPTTGVASPTQTGKNIGVKSANSMFSPLVFLALGILMS